MRYTVDQTNIRALNQRIILDRIYRNKTISPAELCRQLHISSPAMNDNVTALMEAGIIEEANEARPHGKGRTLQFNKLYGCLVAIDLNLEDPIFVLANLRGEILQRHSFSVSSEAKYDERRSLAIGAVEQLLKAQGADESSLLSIAISTPGIYFPEAGIHRIHDQRRGFTEWKISTLKNDMQSRFNVDILVENDINAACIGEQLHGIGRDAQNMLMVTCGMGLGSGMIINGRLYEGSNHSAGEISYARSSSPEGSTYENMVHIPRLIHRFTAEAPSRSRDALKAIRGDSAEPTFKDIVQLYNDGDKFVQACVDEIARSLGMIISNTLCLLNPEKVVFGGDYLAFAPRMMPIINSIVEKVAYQPVPVLVSELGKDAGIHGLFALSVKRVLDELCSRAV